jgi:hypothetical protein
MPKRLKADKQLPSLGRARRLQASAASTNAHLGKTAKAAQVVKQQVVKQQYPLRAFQRQAGHPVLNATTQVK